MDRIKEMNFYLNQFKNEWLIEKIKECGKREAPGLINISKNLLSEYGKDQDKSCGHKLSYISLFHLRSSVWTGSYRYRLCAADASLYLDAQMKYKDWVPEHLYKDAQELKKTIP